MRLRFQVFHSAGLEVVDPDVLHVVQAPPEGEKVPSNGPVVPVFAQVRSTVLPGITVVELGVSVHAGPS